MSPIRPTAATFAALALVALVATARPSHAQALPAAKDLMDKHDAAIGGRAALDKHTSMHQAGTLSMAAAGLEATIEVFRAKPSQFVQKIVLGPMGEVAQGFDGKTAWAVQPGQGAMLLDSTMTAQVKYSSDFFGNFHDMARYKSAETVELADFEGRQCYKVKIVRVAGGEGFEYFDAATGLAAGTISSTDTPMGKVEQTSVFSEYKDFGGVRIPTKIKQKGAMGEVMITITTMEFDTVSPATFALPEAVKALIKP